MTCAPANFILANIHILVNQNHSKLTDALFSIHILPHPHFSTQGQLFQPDLLFETGRVSNDSDAVPGNCIAAAKLFLAVEIANRPLLTLFKHVMPVSEDVLSPEGAAALSSCKAKYLNACLEVNQNVLYSVVS